MKRRETHSRPRTGLWAAAFVLVASAAAAGPGFGADTLEDAYRKEFAFLEAQKREIQTRLDRFQKQAGDEQAGIEKEIAALTAKVLALDERGRRLRDAVDASERALQISRDNAALVEGTLEQGKATLEEYGRGIETPESRALKNSEKIRELYRAGDTLIRDLSRIRSVPGRFFLADGTRQEGTILKIGNIAAFGISEKGSGALAPAGAGEYKIWPGSGGEDAKALASGARPAALGLFLYESLKNAVDTEGKQTLTEYIASGGVIAWVIVGLGAIACLLVVLRALFLKQAGTSTGTLMEEVGALVQRSDIEGALAACRSRRGSAARVAAAVLRNLDRDRDHLEDIVAENIMHEASILDRFGAIILMIAGVAPLLGLLGTVTGMISTFDVITEFGTGDPKMLSGGIATALVTTQLGLVVAIPALMFGSLLSSWGNRIRDDMEKAALRITTIHHRATAARTA